MQIFCKCNRLVALACLCTSAFTMLAPVRAMAQSPDNPGWQKVLNLKPGDRVSVKLFGKRRARAGKVERVEAGGIALAKRGGSTLLRKEDIQKVGYFTNPKLDAVAGWMTVGGLALSTGAETAGTIQDLNQLSNNKLTTTTGIHNVGLVVAGLGVAVTGLVIYFTGGRPHTIYQAQ